MTSAMAATSYEEHVAHVTRHDLFFVSVLLQLLQREFPQKICVSFCDAVTDRGDSWCDKDQFEDLVGYCTFLVPTLFFGGEDVPSQPTDAA
jgi:hypothetical protein